MGLFHNEILQNEVKYGTRTETHKKYSRRCSVYHSASPPKFNLFHATPLKNVMENTIELSVCSSAFKSRIK